MDRSGTIGLMTALGAITGVISATIPDSIPDVIAPVSSLLFLDGSSVHPGLLFGLVVAFGFWWVGERRAWALCIVFFATVLAWSAAMNTAFAIYEIKDFATVLGNDGGRSAADGPTESVKLMTGLLAGLVGAAIVVLGGAIVAPSFRGIVPVGITALVGGVAGLLLYPFFGEWSETLSLLVLFTAWQASIGACLGRWLA